MLKPPDIHGAMRHAPLRYAASRQGEKGVRQIRSLASEGRPSALSFEFQACFEFQKMASLR